MQYRLVDRQRGAMVRREGRAEGAVHQRTWLAYLRGVGWGSRWALLFPCPPPHTYLAHFHLLPSTPASVALLSPLPCGHIAPPASPAPHSMRALSK